MEEALIKPVAEAGERDADRRKPSAKLAELSALLRGSIWLSCAELGAALCTACVAVVAARLIEPRAFGSIGAVLLVVSMLEATTQSGFDRALTQRPGEVGPFLDVAWTWQVLRGAALTGLSLALAPLVARWYHEPALAGMMLVVGLCPLLRGFQNMAVVGLARQLDFRRQLALRLLQALGAMLLTLPALWLLRNWQGLAARALLGAMVSVLVSFAIVPRRPRLVWDTTRLRELLRYGRWVTGSAFIVFVITQGDDLFVSKYLGLEALGLYQMAFWLSNLPATHVAHLVSRVTFPVFASLQGQPERLQRAFLGVLSVVSLLSFSVSAALLVAAPALVEYVLGQRWLPAVPALRLLAVSGLLRSLAATGGALFQAIGRPDLELKQNLPRFLVLVVLIWPMALRFQLPGVCLTVIIALVPALVVWAVAVRRLLDLSLRELFMPFAISLPIATLLAATLYTAGLCLPQGPAGALCAGLLGSIAWLALLALTARFAGFNVFRKLSDILALLRESGG